MNVFLLGLLVCCTFAVPPILADDAQFSNSNSRYPCGIRKKFLSFFQYNYRTAERGQWPWHAALFHGSDYKCGGTLIDNLHVLTTSHCVLSTDKKILKSGTITIQLGKKYRDEYSEKVQIMRVSKILVPPEYILSEKKQGNEIALLVLSQSVQFSDYVIPICIEGIRATDWGNMTGQRGWVAGFGDREPKQLKMASISALTIEGCFSSPLEKLYLNMLAVFCGTDDPGYVCQGDIGGGLYMLAGDHWELRGIISFSKLSETTTCDAKKYVVFTNVTFYYEWIKENTGGDFVTVPKRISELKCQEYSTFATKDPNGVCYNSKSPHTVAIIDVNQQYISSGTIISEKFVLSKAPNLVDIFISKFDWDYLWVSLANQADRKVIRGIVHPNYDAETLRHHVMLLELDSPLEFSSRLLPACLANTASENLYDTLLLNGYSNQTANTYDPCEGVNSRVITNKQCNNILKKVLKKYTINQEELCTSDETKGFFFRGGIVGGPLQTFNIHNCMFTQVGVTKVVIPHNAVKKATKAVRYTNVFYRVTAYLGWIEREVWGNEKFSVDTDFVNNEEETPTIVEYDYED